MKNFYFKYKHKFYHFCFLFIIFFFFIILSYLFLLLFDLASVFAEWLWIRFDSNGMENMEYLSEYEEEEEEAEEWGIQQAASEQHIIRHLLFFLSNTFPSLLAFFFYFFSASVSFYLYVQFFLFLGISLVIRWRKVYSEVLQRKHTYDSSTSVYMKCRSWYDTGNMLMHWLCSLLTAHSLFV